MARLAVALAVVAVVGLAPSAAAPASGTLVTATPAQLQSWADKPGRVWRFPGNGRIDSAGLFATRADVYGYGCVARGCMTFYAFQDGRLLGFYTRSSGFHTRAGTHVGTSLTQARLHEPRAAWAGFGVQCPAIVLPSSGNTEFKADVTRTPPRVSDLLLSRSPPAFADGC